MATVKDALRQRIKQIVNDHAYRTDNSDRVYIVDEIMDAIDEAFAAPVHITIKPSDEQLEKIRKEFQEAATVMWVFGDPSITCGAAENSIDQTYAAENKAALWMLGEIP